MKIPYVINLLSFIMAIWLWASCTSHPTKPRVEPLPKLPPAARGNPHKAATPEQAPGNAYEGNLALVYQCMLKNAYEYMFCNRASNCDRGRKWPYSGKSTGVQTIDRLGVFTAGTSGFYNYGDMGKCLLKAVKKSSQRTWWNLKTLERLSGLKSTRGKMFGGLPMYRKQIITWAATNLVPKPDAPFLGVTYRDVYHAILFRAARLFALVYFDIHGQLDEGAKAYRAFVKQHPKRDAIAFLKQRYAATTAGLYYRPEDGTSLTGFHVAGFWLRRHMDGTASTLAKALGKLLRLYDPDFVTGHPTEMHLLN